MSQFYIGTNSGNLPPDVPTEFDLDDGGPVTPVDNILIFTGRDNIDNNDNGIQTANNPGSPDFDPVNLVAVELTNRTTRFITTTNALPTTIFDEDFGPDKAIFSIYGNVLAYDTVNDKASTFDYQAAYRIIDSLNAVELGVDYSNIYEDPEMEATDLLFTVSGNNLVIQVVGVASTVKWSLLFQYRQLNKV